MHDLLRQFGSVPLALAAYNAGPGAVSVRLHPALSRDAGLRAAILGLLRGAGDAAGLATGLDVRLVR